MENIFIYIVVALSVIFILSNTLKSFKKSDNPCSGCSGKGKCEKA